MKDWSGNSKSTFVTLGASNHTDKERQKEDYYATEPKAAKLLLDVENFSTDIWEPASGENHLAEVFTHFGHKVRTSDIIARTPNTEVLDFLSPDNTQLWYGDIITNPPYKWASEFVYKALSLITKGRKVAMFLKLTFLEGKARKELFKMHPPKVVYVSSSRLMCAKNGEFERLKEGGGSAAAYAWFVWEKGYVGETIIKWIN